MDINTKFSNDVLIFVDYISSMNSNLFGLFQNILGKDFPLIILKNILSQNGTRVQVQYRYNIYFHLMAIYSPGPSFHFSLRKPFILIVTYKTY